MSDFGCKYRASAGCTDCSVVVFRSCSLYRKYHLIACAQPLQPFHFVTVRHSSGSPFVPSQSVVWGQCVISQIVSSDMLYKNSQYVWLADRLKSFAVRRAIQDFGGSPVKYFTLESVISSCYSYNRGEFDFEQSVYFLEIYNGNGRTEKAMGMVDSFINLARSVGGVVFLLTSWLKPMIGKDWFELKSSAGGVISGPVESPTHRIAASPSSSSAPVSPVVRSGTSIPVDSASPVVRVSMSDKELPDYTDSDTL